MTKTIYIAADCSPVIVAVVRPGDAHYDPAKGECRRVTPRRLCLVAERTGKDSDAVRGLLRAIASAAVNGEYDNRSIASWAGLIGLDENQQAELIGLDENQQPRSEWRECGECGCMHWTGEPYLTDLCFICWHGPGWAPEQPAKTADSMGPS